MDTNESLAEAFAAQQPRLRAVAYRMLGSSAEAEDAVQEAWLRVSRSDSSEVDNFGGWATTIVARICLDMLRTRTSRREEALDDPVSATLAASSQSVEHDMILADSVGAALLVVLDTLTPPERVAFVLADMFDLSFEDIGRILERSPAAARQLASRARRRVKEAGRPAADRSRQQQLVEAFLAASHAADFTRLLELLDPRVVMRADAAAAAMGAPAEVLGQEAVAKTFSGRAMGAMAATFDGVPGLVWSPGGKPRVAFVFSIEADRVIAIEMVADPVRLGAMVIETRGA